jgi:NTE family protein
MPETSPATGLLLTGGGARAAYQVGVLEAIAEMRRAAGPAAGTGNPFPIITGTSAGAINAAALACGSDNFDSVVRTLRRCGASSGPSRCTAPIRSRSSAAARAGACCWGWDALLAQLDAHQAEVIARQRAAGRPAAAHGAAGPAAGLMQQGHVQALAVTASSYSSGEHVTFFEAAVPMEPWVRSQRLSVRDRITHAHLLASSAIPFVFPATALPMQGHTEYFGDGSMRQSAPIAAAIHLGAQRILADRRRPHARAARDRCAQHPQRLSDAGADRGPRAVEHFSRRAGGRHRAAAPHQRHAGADSAEEVRATSSLRPLDLLLISPSERIDVIAARHVDALPARCGTCWAARKWRPT